MITETITFECITPCFCAGADQTRAEIRPTAIRGALRWWFRALGGTRDQEADVFGGMKPVTASKLLVRVADVVPKPVGVMPQPKGVDPLSYILYFPSVSSDKTRWNPNACFGPGTKFQLQLRQLRSFGPGCEDLFHKTLAAFRAYGSIGMHVTRGLGAVQAAALDENAWKEADDILQDAGFTIRKSPRGHQIWDAILKEAGQWLQGDLRKEWGAGGNKKPAQATALGSAQATALGSAQPVRQTSAIHFRPCKLRDGKLYLTAFEAPHDRILGKESAAKHKRVHVLASRDFSQPLPPPPQHGRR